jgi:hypothetical protein
MRGKKMKKSSGFGSEERIICGFNHRLGKKSRFMVGGISWVQTDRYGWID